MEWIIILALIGILIAIFGMGSDIIIGDYENRGTTVFAFASFLILVIIVLISIFKINHSPKAIDVYRGNTTLEVTYRDSIPIDTTVIFKQRE